MRVPDKSPIFIVILSVIIGLTFIAGGGLCYWRFAALQNKIIKLEAKKVEVGDEKTTMKALEDTQVKLETMRADLKYLELSVASDWYVPTLIEQLESWSRESNLSLNTIRPEPPKPPENKAKTEKKDDANSKDADKQAETKKEAPKPYTELDIVIKVNGKYSDIQKFVDGLNRFPKVLSVRKVQITPTLQSSQMMSGPVYLDAEMTVRAYVFTSKPSTAQNVTVIEGVNKNGGG